MNVLINLSIRYDHYVVNFGVEDKLAKTHQIGQKMLVIPASTAICERGFSKQNVVKSTLRSRLRLNTLDALMCVSLCGLGANEINWQVVLQEWRNMRDRRILVLD